MLKYAAVSYLNKVARGVEICGNGDYVNIFKDGILCSKSN